MKHETRSRTLRLLAGFAFALALVGLMLARGASPAAADGSLAWDGQGFGSNGLPNSIQCDSNFTPQLQWNFTLGGGSNTVTSATLTVNGVPYSSAGQTGNVIKFFTPFFTASQITSASVSFVGNLGSNANLTVSHGCPGGIVEPGSLHITKTAISDVCNGTSVTYTYTVSNGSATFAFTGSLTDNVLGTVSSSFTVPAGGSKTFTKAGTVTGVVTNTATASGTFNDSVNTSASVTSAPVTVTGHTCTISLTKTPSTTDVCNGSSTSVTYTYVVKNTGDFFSASGSISDDQLGSIGSFGPLAPGASQTLTKTATINGDVTNIATASATFSDGAGTTASAQATATVTGHTCRITVKKSVDVTDVCNGSNASVTYTYVIENKSGFFDASVNLSDDKLGDLGTFTVGHGATKTVTKSTNVNGTVTNTVTATATFGDAASTTSTDTSTATVTGHDCTISLTKTPSTTDVCNGSSTSVTYTYVVKNTGDFFNASGSISDDQLGSIGSFGPLAPGASQTLTATTAITGTTTNKATASATFDDGAATTASASASATVTGHDCTISVKKTASKTSYCGTSTSVTYTYVVTNNSDKFTASGSVTDDKLGSIGSFGPLAPGASQTLTKTATITGSVTNTATASATFNDSASTKATATSTATVTNTGACPLTPGYWKNHQAQTQALLNTGKIKLGNYQVTTFTQASAIFNAMNCSSTTSQGAVGCLAGHLLAAELNLANGSSGSCIQATVDAANAFLSGGVADGVTGIVYVGPSGTYNLTSAQRAEAINLKSALDAFNNGQGC